MELNQLTYQNLRNYQGKHSVDFSSACNIFLGANGQGKTNLLEAIYYLSHGRSPRTSTDKELIHYDADFATLTGTIQSGGVRSDHQLDIQWQETESKRLQTVFKVDGNRLKSRSMLLGFLPSVSFFVSDLLLLRGAPDDRRKWLDSAVVQYDKRHLTYLSEFNRTRQQKNQLLKQFNDPSSPASRQSFAEKKNQLQLWNKAFAENAARVMYCRLQYLLRLLPVLEAVHLELTGGATAVGLQYVSHWDTTHLRDKVNVLPVDKLDATDVQFSLEAIEAQLNVCLEVAMSDELRRGTCVVGPHRDDVMSVLSDLSKPDQKAFEAHIYGSQGQQRTVVLALKLAELQLLTQVLQGDVPVLLLDDVMAELDPDRQRFLLTHINPKSQVFLTTTHLDASLEPLLKYWHEGRDDQTSGDTLSKSGFKVFDVFDGEVKENQTLSQRVNDVDVILEQP